MPHHQAVLAVLITVLPAVQHLPDPSIDPLYLEVALALLGAALGGLLLTPIMRITRSFAAAMNPPEWAQDQLALSPWHTLTLHLNLILPAIATVIWVTTQLAVYVHITGAQTLNFTCKLPQMKTAPAVNASAVPYMDKFT